MLGRKRGLFVLVADAITNDNGATSTLLPSPVSQEITRYRRLGYLTCGSIFSDPTPPTTRPADSSSSKGIRCPPQRSRAPIRAAVEAVPWVLSLGAARAGIIADRLAFLVKATRLDWRGGPEVGTPHSGGVPGPIMLQFMLREVG
jgi:hypothetical protein